MILVAFGTSLHDAPVAEWASFEAIAYLVLTFPLGLVAVVPAFYVADGLNRLSAPIEVPFNVTAVCDHGSDPVASSLAPAAAATAPFRERAMLTGDGGRKRPANAVLTAEGGIRNAANRTDLAMARRPTVAARARGVSSWIRTSLEVDEKRRQCIAQGVGRALHRVEEQHRHHKCGSPHSSWSHTAPSPSNRTQGPRCRGHERLGAALRARTGRNAALRAQIVALALPHGRYGAVMIHLKLRQAGERAAADEGARWPTATRS